MNKLILFVLIVVFAWWVIKTYRRSISRQKRPAEGAAEDMVQCEHCGVHLPRSECHRAEGRIFCSEEHKQQHL